MKDFFVIAFFAALLSLSAVFAQGPDTPGAPKSVPPKVGCTGCAAAKASSPQVPEAATKQIPGSGESMVVGRVENLVPIGVLAVLGCEKCSAQAVDWALQQGSSFEDVERTLRAVAAMRNLDCFSSQFGPEVATRMEKPLAAAKEALEQAKMRASK